MQKLSLSLLLLLLVVACTPKESPIEYGADKCDFCRMTIVDQQHAAEVVTTKGRVYKFDAIECMLSYREQESDKAFALSLVNDYLASGVLLDATTCTYLISPNIPSPMGANLSAFAMEEKANAFQQEKGGKLYTWTSLQELSIAKGPDLSKVR
jgi:copper chaperone NosL